MDDRRLYGMLGCMFLLAISTMVKGILTPPEGVNLVVMSVGMIAMLFGCFGTILIEDNRGVREYNEFMEFNATIETLVQARDQYLDAFMDEHAEFTQEQIDNLEARWFA